MTMQSDIKNILVVNVNWVGDVIFSAPVFSALKSAYPQAKISCLAPLRVVEILESNPHVDDIIVYEESGEHANPLAKLKLILQLRRKQFDAVFLLHRSLTKALLVFLAGVPVRVGYDTKGRGFLLTHHVKPLSSGAHRMDYYLNVVESFGVEINDKTYVLDIDNEASRFIDKILAEYHITKNDFLVVIHPGGNWDLKRWPKEHFAALINRLMGQLSCKVILAGGKDDIALVESILKQTQHKPIALTGQMTLKQLMALMQKARVVISADSGPLHLASSVGTQTIGLFGPTRPEVTGPRGKVKAVIVQNDVACNRTPCYFLSCPDNICMKSITAEQVFNEIRKIKN